MKNPSDEGSDIILPEDDGLDNGSLSDLLEGRESDGGGDLDERCCEDNNIENSSACDEVIDEIEEHGLLSESEGGPSGEKKRRKGDSSNEHMKNHEENRIMKKPKDSIHSWASLT